MSEIMDDKSELIKDMLDVAISKVRKLDCPVNKKNAIINLLKNTERIV